MIMPVVLVRYIVVVGVRMVYCMRMSGAIVRVLNGMFMRVIVSFGEGINYNDCRSQNHYSKTCEISPIRFFMKDHKGQGGAYKRSDRIKSARFRCSDNSLCLDVEEYAQPIRDEA